MTAADQQNYMQLALECAQKSPPKPTNYCVGAVLVEESANQLLSTGYTLELPGNTHAEQCCFQKLAEKHKLPEERLGEVLSTSTVLYTTMEPCVERLSGNLPCVKRILRLKRADGTQAVSKVYTGVQEPGTFVQENQSKRLLQEAGISYLHVEGFEEQILKVATAGHEKSHD